MPGPSEDDALGGLVPLSGSLATTAPTVTASGVDSGFGSLRKVNFASSPVPSASTMTLVPGRSSPKRIFSDSMSSISRWIVRRSGRAPSTGS